MQLSALEDASPEAVLMRSVASDIIRRKTGNTGAIFGQIGFECSPCSGNCPFCSFAKDYTMMPIINMCDEAIAEATRNFTGGDDLYGLHLMTMPDYDLDKFLRKVEIVKRNMNHL